MASTEPRRIRDTRLKPDDVSVPICKQCNRPVRGTQSITLRYQTKFVDKLCVYCFFAAISPFGYTIFATFVLTAFNTPAVFFCVFVGIAMPYAMESVVLDAFQTVSNVSILLTPYVLELTQLVSLVLVTIVGVVGLLFVAALCMIEMQSYHK